MTRALLISNPFAARAHSRAVAGIRDILQRGGWNVDVHTTAGPGDARQVAEDARGAGFDVLVSHGGDGTAMQVAAGIVGTGVALGLLPGGTGNLLAGNLRLPRTATGAARALLKARRLQIDVGVIDRDDGPHYFAVAAGTGFDAQLMADTGLQAKRRWKFGAYVGRALTSLSTVRSVPHRVTIDGTVHEIPAAMFLVLNCGKLLPGFMNIRAGLVPDDGWFDVVAVAADGALESATAVLELLFSSESKGRRVWWSRGRNVRVELPGSTPRPVQLDGEVFGTTPFEARLLARALPVLVGPDFKAHQ
jgi:YegS/Rv2252/BmrU family lipid kinase